MARSRRTMKYLGAVSVFLALVLLLMAAVVGSPVTQAGGDPTWTQTTFDDFFQDSEKNNVLVIDIGVGEGDVKLAYELSSGLMNWPGPTETLPHGSAEPAIYSNKWSAQTFTADASGNVSSIVLYIGKEGSPGNLVVELRDTVSSEPGPTLASVTISSADITMDGGAYEAFFSTPPGISNGTQYAIVLHQDGNAGSSGDEYHWYYDKSPGYGTGQAWKSIDGGGSWSGFGKHDYTFMINPQAQYYSSGYLISSPHDAFYSANFGTISWNADVPIGTSLKFQIATNSDGSTWNFSGPDGNSSMFYKISGSEIWSGHDGDMYIKYKAYFETTYTSATPVLHQISITYTELTYTLTTNASPPEGGTATGGGTYPYGTLAPITATANPCYAFVNWSGATGITEPTSASTTVLMDGDKTVTATFTIEDTTPPSIDTQASGQTVECDGAGNTADLNAWLNSNGGAAASDICGSVTWSNDFTGLSDDCGATGSATVTFTATDDCDNTATTQATFTIEDTTPPSIDTQASGQTVECDGAGNTADLNAWLNSNGGAAASDICGSVTWSNDFTGLSDDCGATGSATVTFTATDDCDNTATTQATFTIEDTTAPVLTVPADVTIKCGQSTEPSNTGEATATDNCDPNPVITYSDEVSGETCPITITRTWTATDACENYSQETQTITAEPRQVGGGGGGFAGPVCPETLTVDFLGEITEVPMTRSGVLCADCDAPSPDEMHLLEIDEGTTVLDSEGKVVKLIEITEVTAPSLPASTALVGSAYDFGGNLNVTFSKPVTLTLSYNVSDLRDDTLALSMRRYSSEVGLWEVIETESSQVAEIGSLTGTTDSFSVFAILADLPSFEVSNLSISPSEREIWGFPTFAVRKGEEAIVTADVTNTGNYEASYIASLQVNGEIMDSQELTLAPGQTEQVTFTISGIEQGDYQIVVGSLSEPFTSSLWINWLPIGAILGALLLIVLLLVGWRYRKREKPAEKPSE